MMSTEECRRNISTIIMTAPEMIVSFKTKLVTEDMWDYCIERDPGLFIYCKKPSLRLCYKAVNLDGMLIQNVDPTWFDKASYLNLCKVAVENNPKALIVIPKEFVSDDLKSYAYSRDPELLMSEKKLTPSMVEAIILHNPSLLQYVQEPSNDLIIKVLEKEPRAIVYLKVIDDEVRTYFEEHYPEYASMLYIE